MVVPQQGVRNVEDNASGIQSVQGGGVADDQWDLCSIDGSGANNNNINIVQLQKEVKKQKANSGVAG